MGGGVTGWEVDGKRDVKQNVDSGGSASFDFTARPRDNGSLLVIELRPDSDTADIFEAPCAISRD